MMSCGFGGRDFRLLQLLKTDKFDLCKSGPQIQVEKLGSGLASTGIGNLRRPILQFERKKKSLHTVARNDVLLAVI